MMQLLDGKSLAKQIYGELATEVNSLKASGMRAPHLVTILVGKDPASESYVRSKVKACQKIGFQSTELQYPDTISKEELLKKIKALNEADTVDGILVQLPLPSHIPEADVIEATAPEKDVDGFHPVNIGRMTKNLPAILPATPGGIMEMFRRYNIPTKGKHCVVIGRSNIVGTPMSILMSRNSEPGNATVTLTHFHTQGLKQLTLEADIIIVAVGKPNFITADMVKRGTVIIDVGINRIEDESRKSGYRLVGDVDFDAVAPLCSYITPVPGGVGPMTIATLMQNTLRAFRQRAGLAEKG